MAKFAPQYNLFVIIDKIRVVINIVFWTIFALSILPLLLKTSNIEIGIDDLIEIINIVSISLFFVLEILVDYILVPQADNKRRDDFIDNSFGSKFSTNPSIGYFDTDEISKGLYKAASNLFENCFFTYSLVKATTIKKAILPSIVYLSVGVSAYFGFKNVPFALSLLEVLFSTKLLGELIKHCILIAKLNTIQGHWITLFQHSDLKSDTGKYQSYIYRYWLQYETLHSRMQAGIPDRLFKKMNDQLTQEWNELRIRYDIK